MIVAVLSAGVMFPAANVKAVTVEELAARIQELTRQLDVLKRQAATETIMSFSTDLRYGARNNDSVRRLQQFLIGQRYLDQGSATGNFLTLTRNALRRFQGDNALPVTGVLDIKTRNAINGLLREAATAKDGTNAETLIVKMAASTPLIATTSTSVASAAPVEVRPKHRLDPKPAYDLAAIERATFDAVNAERQKSGLGALAWNDRVALVARAHSADQAGDNATITDPDIACPYPFIRHEGFVTGFKVGGRLERAGMQYRLAGENIIILPIGKELVYQAERAAPACVKLVEAESSAGETEETARVRIAKLLADRTALVKAQEALNWVNREWKGAQEIAGESAADWMNSPGHRRNILTPDFEESAIGAAIVNDYIILTQVFFKRL